MHCDYQNGRLSVDGVALADIAAAVGTPCFVYSADAIRANWTAYDQAFGARAHQVCYAVKANDNLSVLQCLKQLGAGFDIVSGGELERVLAAGGRPSDIVFSGVGKTRAEIEQAVAQELGCINVESTAELERVLATAATLGREVRIAVRVNPDVDAKTHPYISTGLKENKFGVPIDDAAELYQRINAAPFARASGIACHIGSQLTSIEPVVEAVSEVVRLATALKAAGSELDHIDVGGGLGIRYADEAPPPPQELVTAIMGRVPEQFAIAMEPGRSIVGPAGVLIARVEYVKKSAAKNFAIVDAAMNDLLRPALYDAWHDVTTCDETPAHARLRCDVVGPVCESGDWIARDRELAVDTGSLLAVHDVGAYGFVMASNYNARPRPAEVLVEGREFRVVRPRETTADLIATEQAHLLDAPK